jgi:hypothetical protein
MKLPRPYACNITKKPIFLLHLTVWQKKVVTIPPRLFHIQEKVQKNRAVLPGPMLVVKRPENEVDCPIHLFRDEESVDLYHDAGYSFLA